MAGAKEEWKSEEACVWFWEPPTVVTQVVGPGGDDTHVVFSCRLFGQADYFHVVVEFNMGLQLD